MKHNIEFSELINMPKSGCTSSASIYMMTFHAALFWSLFPAELQNTPFASRWERFFLVSLRSVKTYTRPPRIPRASDVRKALQNKQAGASQIPTVTFPEALGPCPLTPPKIIRWPWRLLVSRLWLYVSQWSARRMSTETRINIYRNKALYLTLLGIHMLCDGCAVLFTWFIRAQFLMLQNSVLVWENEQK